MKVRLIAIVFVSMASAAVGQHRGPFWSLGGFGNVLFPGTGHPPITPPGGITGPYFFSRGPRVYDRSVPGTAILSGPETAVPEDPNGSSLQNGEQETMPAAMPIPGSPQVIDQTLIATPNEVRPDTKDQPGCEPQSERMDGNESTVHGTMRKPQKLCDGQPTVYLLALKDGSILQSLGYWIRGSILYYVSVDYALNQISLILIDKEVSKRLNTERGIDFSPDLTR